MIVPVSVSVGSFVYDNVRLRVCKCLCVMEGVYVRVCGCV